VLLTVGFVVLGNGPAIASWALTHVGSIGMSGTAVENNHNRKEYALAVVVSDIPEPDKDTSFITRRATVVARPLDFRRRGFDVQRPGYKFFRALSRPSFFSVTVVRGRHGNEKHR
jgi:hypothetical protein